MNIQIGRGEVLPVQRQKNKIQCVHINGGYSIERIVVCQGF